jgi:hypothetical protein
MRGRSFHRFTLVSIVVLGLASCAPKYDAETDKQITDLQLTVNLGFNGLITATKAYEKNPADAKLKDAASYKQNTKFYDDTQSKIRVLQTRVDQTTNLVDNAKVPLSKIDTIVQRTRDYHEQKGVIESPAFISTRDDLNTQFATLVGLMQILKAGSAAGRT